MPDVVDPFMHGVLRIFGIDIAVARKRLATCPFCSNLHIPGQFRYAYASSPTALKRFVHLECFASIPADLQTYSLEYLCALDTSSVSVDVKQAIYDAIDKLKGL